MRNMLREAARLLLLAVLFSLCLAACGKAPAAPSPSPLPTPQGSPEELIEQMLRAYGSRGPAAAEEISQLQAALAAQDADRAALWTAVMDYWRYLEEDMTLQYAVPEDLPEDDSLCIVVLGYQLNDDGSMRPELIDRLNTALACAERYPQARVLCTGGGTAWRNATATEAGEMGAWLLSQGVEPERLSREERSLTTTENALYSYDLLRERFPQVRSVLLVTSGYHVSWGALMLETVFLQRAAEGLGPEMHVVSHCACRTDNAAFSGSMRSVEMDGLLQLLRMY